MKVCYDLIVIYKTRGTDLKSKSYKFSSDNCAPESSELVVEYVIDRVKGDGLISLCVIYLPYLTISNSMINHPVFEVDILHMQCLWTADGYNFCDFVPLYSTL